MAATVTAVGTPSPLHAVFLVVGDGTATAQAIANSTLQAGMAAGALKDAWNTVYADQAAGRLALLVNGCRARTQLRLPVNDVTAEHNQPACDVDMDAVATTKCELNIYTSDTTAQEFYVFLEYIHSSVR